MGKSSGDESSVVFDDENEPEEDYKPGGYHRVSIGDIFIERYEVVQKLGWGHFSTVWLCQDLNFGTYVAVKVQKSAPNYSQAALDEVELLSKIASNSNSSLWTPTVEEHLQLLKITSKHCFVVQLLNTFKHIGPHGEHVCMVLEILGVNLLEIIKAYKYKGIPPALCQRIAKQTLLGLDYLHRVCGIIHTDLKPENVLLQLTQEQMREIITEGRLATKIPEKKQVDDKKQKKLEKKRRYRQRKKEEKRKAKEAHLSTETSEREPAPQASRKRKRNKNKNKDKAEQSQVIEEETEITNEPQIDDQFDIKIADLGNACWVTYHYSDLIQTRQYRSPEVILGITYNHTADMWSFACMFFELLTGDLLFEPKGGESFDKNDDHLAQMIETLGVPSIDWALSGRYSKKFFNRFGVLKKVKELKVWLLEDVLIEKYRVRPSHAKALRDFLLPMLHFQPELRASAEESLKYQWLSSDLSDFFLTPEEYIDVVNKLDEQKAQRIEKIERDEPVTSPEIPMPYCDDADNEFSGVLEDSFFTDEDDDLSYQIEENEEYHTKMKLLREKIL